MTFIHGWNGLNTPCHLKGFSRRSYDKELLLHQRVYLPFSFFEKTLDQEFDFHGDTNKQLARAMKAFSSSFARANRRKLLRKHFLAFDVNNTQRISRAQFVDTVNEVRGGRTESSRFSLRGAGVNRAKEKCPLRKLSLSL